jgi:threonine aldolase
MRQVGLLAAAAHYALDHNIDPLAHDHRRAKEIALAMNSLIPSLIDPTTVHTNIVGLDLSQLDFTAAELANRCKEAGLLIGALGPKYARLVTHLDIDDEQTKYAIEVLKRSLVA